MVHRTLVSAGRLAAHLADPDWIVFDCRHDLARPDWGEQEYGRAHIPGARFLHLDRDLSSPVNGNNGRHPLPDPEVLAAKLGKTGVEAEKQVIAYDSQGGMCASRLWWLLRWLGHDAVAVLDGGWSGWIADSRPQSTVIPEPANRVFRAAPRQASVGADYVLSRLQSPGMLLLDARSPDRFRGENETLDPVGGRIPGAANRCFRDNLDANGRFKAPQLLRQEILAVIGESKPQDMVHMCGSGVSACHNLLAMEIAGMGGGRLYAGSWSEWCADPSRPIARG